MQAQDNDNELDFTALIQELGIDRMPPQEQEQVLGDVMDTVNMRGIERLARELTDEQQKQINALTQENPEQAEQALLQMIPHERQVQIYQEEIEAVKEEIKKEAAMG